MQTALISSDIVSTFFCIPVSIRFGQGSSVDLIKQACLSDHVVTEAGLLRGGSTSENYSERMLELVGEDARLSRLGCGVPNQKHSLDRRAHLAP